MSKFKNKLMLSLFVMILSFSAANAQTKLPPVWDAKDVAILLIDYQPEMFANIKSSDPKEVELQVRCVARLAKAHNIPVVLSTVSVYNNINKPTIDVLLSDLPAGITAYDRSSMDAWEDKAFVDAVKATGKKRLIVCGLFTEICLTYSVLEMRAAGYEVMFIEDAVGGLSKNNHEQALKRMIQAGAIPNTVGGLSAELFRDWKRPEAKGMMEFQTWYFETARKYWGEVKFPPFVKKG